MTTEEHTAPAFISDVTLRQLLAFQQSEVTEAETYRCIAAHTKDGTNRATLLRIAHEEDRHGAVWQRYTGKKLKPDNGKVFLHAFIARLFGFTFAVKLMERGEAKAQVSYEKLSHEVPEALSIRADEETHEKTLLAMLFDAAHYLWALGVMLVIVLLILVVFNYYLSVAKDLSFKKRFGQMAGISLGVAALSFVIGILVKMLLGVDV